MGKIKTLKNRFLFNVAGIDDLLEIRTDFLDIYKFVISHPHYRKEINHDSSVWYSRAIETGTRAEYYDPHKKIINLINLITFLLGIPLGLIVYTILPIPIIGIFIAITPLTLLKIYGKFLSLDTELIQTLNKKMSFKIGELQKFKRTSFDDIVVAAIWNMSLRNPNTIPMVVFLRIIKIISDKIYKIIIKMLKLFSHVYIDHGQSKNKLFVELIRWVFPSKINK